MALKRTRVGEMMVQWEKYLLHKHEDLSSDPKILYMCVTVTPELRVGDRPKVHWKNNPTHNPNCNLNPNPIPKPTLTTMLTGSLTLFLTITLT